MNNRFGLKEHCITDIVNVLKLQPEVEEAIIFGSRAMGTYKNGSDIDIALKGEKITFDTISTLRLRLDELPYLYMYDIIDYKKISNPAVTAHIDELGITFYKKQTMPNDWKTYKLGDLIEINKNSIGRNYHFSEITYIDTSSVTENRFTELQFLKLDEAPSRAKRIVNENDIIYSTVRPIQRHYGIIKKAKPNLVASTGFAVLTAKKIDPNFLYYYLSQNQVVGYFNSVAESNTTTFPAFNASLFETFEITAPSLPTQRQIAQILSSLDDKIELNLQMNQTLEAMAQAIFKEWFVDFNFPGFDGELVDGLPKGWRKGRLGEVFNLIMGQSPPGTSYNEFAEGMVFYQGRTDFGFRFPTNRLYTTEPKRIANPLDTLVSVRAPVGDINMANEMCCVGRGLSSVRHKSDAYSFTYYMMKNLEPIFNGFEGEGTVFGSINKSNFESIEIIIPSDEIVCEFETVVNPIDDKILENTNQIKSLTQLRDTLLPKLMSGQLEVKK